MSLNISLWLVITVLAVLLGVLIAMIVLAVKSSKFKSKEKSYVRDLELKDLTISEQKVDLKSSKMKEDQLTEEVSRLNSKLSEQMSSIHLLCDGFPQSLDGRFPDLTNKKDFRACWLKLQNEAFQSKVLGIENGLLIMKYVK